MWRDRYFLAALTVAPVVWFFLLLINQPGMRDLQIETATWQRLLLLGLLYPVLEELAFRGFLQSRLYRYPFGRFAIAGLSGANIITSILFVTAHFLYHSWLWSLLVFAPSLLFGWFRDKYKSVVPGIWLHSFYNLGFYLFFG